MESIVKEDIISHLTRNKLVRTSQHGFMKGKSTTTNLLEFLDKLSGATDKGIATDVIYLDFAKAFDKVPTERLLKKVAAHGIGGKVGKWIRVANRQETKSERQWKTIWLAECTVRSTTGQCSRPGPVSDLHQRPGHGDNGEADYQKIC